MKILAPDQHWEEAVVQNRGGKQHWGATAPSPPMSPPLIKGEQVLTKILVPTGKMSGTGQFVYKEVCKMS